MHTIDANDLPPVTHDRSESDDNCEIVVSAPERTADDVDSHRSRSMSEDFLVAM